MRVVVLGGRGQLGQAFGRIAPEFPSVNIILTDLPEVDICDIESIRGAIAGADAVINCAAWTAVDSAEIHPEEAMRINRDGARLVAEAASEHGLALVYISTDYIFDGHAHEPVLESCAPAPLGIYGASKLAGEEAVRIVGGRSIIVRTAWLYSEFGNNFVRTMLRIGREQRQVRVVDDQQGSPTYAVDLAAAILWLIERGIGAGTELYHYVNSGSTSWYGFAQAIFREADYTVAVHPISADAYPTLARRPRYSVLDTTKLVSMGLRIPTWQDALRRCITVILRETK